MGEQPLISIESYCKYITGLLTLHTQVKLHNVFHVMFRKPMHYETRLKGIIGLMPELAAKIQRNTIFSRQFA